MSKSIDYLFVFSTFEKKSISTSKLRFTSNSGKFEVLLMAIKIRKERETGATRFMVKTHHCVTHLHNLKRQIRKTFACHSVSLLFLLSLCHPILSLPLSICLTIYFSLLPYFYLLFYYSLFFTYFSVTIFSLSSFLYFYLFAFLVVFVVIFLFLSFFLHFVCLRWSTSFEKKPDKLQVDLCVSLRDGSRTKLKMSYHSQTFRTEKKSSLFVARCYSSLICDNCLFKLR